MSNAISRSIVSSVMSTLSQANVKSSVSHLPSDDIYISLLCSELSHSGRCLCCGDILLSVLLFCLVCQTRRYFCVLFLVHRAEHLCSTILLVYAATAKCCEEIAQVDTCSE